MHLSLLLLLLQTAPAGPDSGLLGELVENSLPNGIASGEVSTDSVLLWTRASAPGTVRFELATDPAFEDVVFDKLASANTPFEPIKVRARELAAGTQHYIRVTGPGEQVLEGRVKTAALPEARVGLRFGVSGDSRGELRPYDAISNAPERDLDFFVLLGDTIYADFESPIAPGVEQVTTLRGYQAKHQEVNSAVEDGPNYLAELRATCAVMATIDDHEVTNDFAGGAPPSSHPLFEEFAGTFELINQTPIFQAGLEAFQDYHPLSNRFYPVSEDPKTSGQPDLYRFQTFGLDAATIVLDARSFRDEPLPEADLLDPESIGEFLAASFDPTRTMLGKIQVERLKADLLAADEAGVLWKFVFVPEPIQNLGVTAAPDRFEGYAAERTEILSFIDQNEIDHVVFVAADVHGTLVNNITYQQSPISPQIPTSAFEITTGAIAFDAPFGPTVVGLAAEQGLLSAEELAFYQSLPTAAQDAFLQDLVDTTLGPLGYDSLGLEGAPIQAELLQGGWVSTHTWGWTEFDIDGESGVLEITTYGLVPFIEESPNVLQKIRVTP